jgi:hypothetical protein
LFEVSSKAHEEFVAPKFRIEHHCWEEKMPEDPSKNIGQYKIAGGEMNEYEFQQNQEEFAKQQDNAPENLIPGTPPGEEIPDAVDASERVTPPRATTRKRTTKKAGSKKATKTTKKAAAKKSAAKKRPTTKKSAKKATKKSASRKSTKKSGAKRGSTKKRGAATKKAAKRRSASGKKRASKK